jgi:hypothetical protein
MRTARLVVAFACARRLLRMSPMPQRGVAGRIGKIGRCVLAYLKDHPKAGDTLDGIVDWWIPRQRLTEARARVQLALDDLKTRGLIVERRLRDGRAWFSIASREDAP